MREKHFGIIILYFSIVIALFPITFIIISNLPAKNGTGSINIISSGKDVSEVEIRNQVAAGNINIIELNNDSINLLEVKWDIAHRGLHLPQNAIQLTYTIENSCMIININSLVEINYIISLNLNIFFNPTYTTYSFISNTQNGNVNFNASGINIKDFYFRTSSGNLNIKMNNTSIENNFEVSTDTGDIDVTLDHISFFKNFFSHSNSGIQLFDLWNINFESVADFNVSSNTGYTRVHWMNHFNKSQSVNINVNSNNDIKVKFWCPLEIMRGDISLSTVNGTTRISKAINTYEEISENYYQTPFINDTSLDSYNITARSTSGEVYVYYVDCFKWLRFCNWGMDFSKYKVDVSGNHSIFIQEHDVTTINLFNTKFIYLNEFRNLTIKFDTLPVSSEKLLYIEWDLDIIHAMGIGVGDLNLKISKDNTSDILLVYIELHFELDRILPTFNDYNITVQYHPNFIFDQFLI